MTLREDFAALVAGGEDTDLGRAALAIARIAYPALDIERHVAELDALAAPIRPRLTPATAPEDAAAGLGEHLFGELRFRGNREDYYDPRNSFLNDVLARRTGIPISLAVVLIETAARVGVRLEGVGFPGHFLVRIAGSTVLRDPFFGGRVIGDEELLARYRALGASQATTVPPAALERAGTPAILLRMLRNLLHIYLRRRDPARALETVDLTLVLAPDSADELRTRGFLYQELECGAAARADFERYLDLAPTAPDADDVRARIVRLTRRATTLH